ncbi:methyltransferase [Polymorphobacter arshaanensis]|uniref:Methyltransferase n=2 Tax=Glacieibacterium arshaanense TaxID=2511025 RepID=A0A4Y9EL81_9SPHN|nr:methyltransferase [Polymorphobacter arshaanensis]
MLASSAIAQTPANITAAVTSPQRPASDTERDAARKPGVMLDFSRVKPGDHVADLIPGHGYFTRLFAVAVKPGGKVIAIVPPEAAKRDAEGAAMIAAIAADPAYGDVTVVDGVGSSALGKVDVFWTAQNYHDLHNALSVDQVIEVNETIFKAVKPGGYYVIVDHAAAPGSGLSAANALHRIDPETVKGEVEAAGFILDGESSALANPADPHTANVFDPSIRGKTDQFMLRFKKPK